MAREINGALAVLGVGVYLDALETSLLHHLVQGRRLYPEGSGGSAVGEGQQGRHGERTIFTDASRKSTSRSFDIELSVRPLYSKR